MTGDARTIVEALGGQWRGNSGIARRPAHADKRPSLKVTDRNGKTLFHCWAGCEQSAVLEALRALGLWQSGSHQARIVFRSPAPRSRDWRDLRWLIDDIHLLDAEPTRANVWAFLDDAVELGPLSVEWVSRRLQTLRPASAGHIRAWMECWFGPAAQPALGKAA